jgi:PrcB C-terminal
MTPLLAVVFAALLQPAPVPLETVARDAMSGIEEPRQVAVRTDDEWTRLWREHAGARPAPRVDFATKMVLAVFLGTRPSAGFAVEIVDARAEGTGLVVTWSERRPSRDTMTAQVLTSPAHFVAVPRVAGAIRFEKAGQ